MLWGRSYVTPMTSHDIIGMIGGGGSVMESDQIQTLDQYFIVIGTIPHISIKTQSICIPTYFSVNLKPREVIIMHKNSLKFKTILCLKAFQQMTASVMSRVRPPISNKMTMEMYSFRSFA